jgi:hypothetical protein
MYFPSSLSQHKHDLEIEQICRHINVWMRYNHKEKKMHQNWMQNK